jgi:hypothetical protein
MVMEKRNSVRKSSISLESKKIKKDFRFKKIKKADLSSIEKSKLPVTVPYMNKAELYAK